MESLALPIVEGSLETPAAVARTWKIQLFSMLDRVMRSMFYIKALLGFNVTIYIPLGKRDDFM